MAFLGLDVGGTHCRYEWWPEGAHPAGAAPGVQPAVHGVDATVLALSAVVRDATANAEPEASVCAIAGAGDAAIAGAIGAGLRASGLTFPIAVVTDVLAAAAVGLADRPGVLLMAGTGSFAVARGRDDQLVRVGGRGYLLGDRGSAYDFVRRAAAAALLAVDGLGPPTLLTERLTAAFGAPSPQRLGAVVQGLEPSAIARHLSVVLAAAAEDDVVAKDVIESGVDELEQLVLAAARRAGLPERTTVALGGGVLQDFDGPILASVVHRLSSRGMLITQVLAGRDAARGAAWLAHGWHRREQPQHRWVEHVAL